MLESQSLLDKHSEKERGFLFPFWDIIGDEIEKNVSVEEQASFWLEITRDWLIAIKDNLEGSFKLQETENFLILSDEVDHVDKNLRYQCERSLEMVLDQLGSEFTDEGYGKHVIIIFKHIDQYFEYVSYFSSDGEMPLSGGMCINGGYTHIVVPYLMEEQVPVEVITHELTHALLSEYSIPNWLDESLAMRMEDVVLGYSGLSITKEDYKKHIDYWNESSIQAFWSGEVWQEASVGFELSYELARVLWRKIEVDIKAEKEEVIKFIQTASRDDSGNTAFKVIFEHSLGDLVTDFLGEGDWEPNVEYLSKKQETIEHLVGWAQDRECLTELSEEEILSLPISEIKLSEELHMFCESLSISTVDDLVNMRAEDAYKCSKGLYSLYEEMSNKLSFFRLVAKYEQSLDVILETLALFQDGRITGANLAVGGCDLDIEIEYLAQMIKPHYKVFRLEFSDFIGYDIELKEGSANGDIVKSMQLEKALQLGLKINDVEQSPGCVILSCVYGEQLGQYEETPLSEGDFPFSASAVKVFDEEGKEWSLESLKDLADDYWQGG